MWHPAAAEMAAAYGSQPRRDDGRRYVHATPFECANLSRLRPWQRPDDALPSRTVQGEIMSKKFNRRHFIAAGTAAVAAPFLLRGASAQGAWPSRNIRMVRSYPAGGQTDLLARAFGDYICRQVGKTVVIENKAGASGSIGAAEVARAEPDGHTILCSISTTYYDEPGDDEEPRLRHGQGFGAGQRHPGRRAAAGREPEIRHQVAGRLRRLCAQERQDEFRHLQRGLVPAHHHQ